MINSNMINFKKDKFTCCVIGLGYVGLPTASLIAATGNKVFGIDINQSVVDTINDGKIHLVENDLQDLVTKVVSSGHLLAKSKPCRADVFLIAVPTPLEENTEGIPNPNINYVIKAASAISKVVKKDNLIILESTSPVGTTEKIADLICNLSSIEKNQISIAYCPERVLPGKALEEIIVNNRVVGGVNHKSSLRGENFYESFCKGKIIKTNSRTAEMVKLTENAYRDVNIAFANEISMISDEFGINHQEIINIANNHPRVNILKPGCGVGGHCIAIDPWFIASQIPEKSNLIQSAREVNTNKTEWSIRLIENKIKNLEKIINRKPIVGIFGITFKQDIDDIRESPALYIAEKLSNNGNHIIICEPNINSLNGFDILSSDEVLMQSDVYVILVPHSQFKNIEFGMKLMIDFCGIK